jgi:glutathionyl-hydroquinone reductase
MVRGLDRFKAHFEPFSDRYVLIGGTACSIAMNDVGLDFRATRDLDIVLCVEALDGDFVKAFWAFIRNGNYVIQEKCTGKKQFYRFKNPDDGSYPVMWNYFRACRTH